ncbi:MAG: NAD(P)-binding protein, partial [Firmicutes bacterium]|nr:NAD(P)-binding protein [Bacillota bacterium]
AIVGAGVAGLTCALELQRRGVVPEVFEQRPSVGDPFPHVGGILQLFNRPVRDQLRYLHREFGLALVPLAPMRRIVMKTPHSTREVRGRLGYFFLRGRDPRSLENQLRSAVTAPIHFNTRGDHRYLARRYDYVVVATGNNEVPAALGCWQPLTKAVVRGAVVLGEFDPHTIVMWLNTQYAKGGYAYLTPFSARRASLVLNVPDVGAEAVDYYWATFWRAENLRWEAVEDFVLEHHFGCVYPHRVGNVLLAGIAGGFMEPFLGFGLLGALKSGALAGRAIATGRDYEELVASLRRRTHQTLVFREWLNRATNRDLDLLVRLLTSPGVRQLVYNTNLDWVEWASRALTLWRRAADRLRLVGGSGYRGPGP